MQAVRTKSATTHTVRAQLELRERIIDGTYPQGTRLMEVALADTLGISRTPIREAMARLAEEGLLERVPSGGFRVRSFGIADARDAIEVRGVLEGTCARLAAERGVPPELMDGFDALVAELDALFTADADDFDFERYSTLNTAFHEKLWELSGSKIVQSETARVATLPFAAPSAFLAQEARIGAFHTALIVAQEQHRAIADAIRRREGARAEALAREHTRNAKQNLDDLVAQRLGHSSLALVASPPETGDPG